MVKQPRRPLVPSQTEAVSTPSDRNETVAQPASDAPAAPAFGSPVEPGEVGRLGPYRVVKELGRGGMGAVYAALDTRLDRRLALKVMLPRYAADPAAKARFLREARAAARVKHDNVITVYEADERDGVPYIAMEFLEGYPLDQYLRKKGGPTIPQVLRIAAEAAAGLAAAHKLGLVHRDVKPANLWLEAPHGRVKVLDFGLARPVDAEVELTQSGAVVGTPAYMSPEQARGEKVDARTDLFSLGVLLYRLCTGKLPFEGPTTMAVLMALGTQEPRPVRELNPSAPGSLAALIHQLLAKKADDRPRTAEEVVRRLRAIAQEPAGSRARPAEGSPSQPPAVQAPVAYAPMQVTAPPPGANPFADIDADVTETEPASAAASAPKPAQKKSGDKTPWMFAGLAALLAAGVVAGVIIIIKNKDGSETKIEAPDGATVTIKDKDGKTLAPVGPRIKPPAAASDPERQAAEYVVSLGGYVRVNGLDRDFKAAAELPKERFTLAWVHLRSPKVTEAGLAAFEECKGLTFIDLAGTTATDAGLAHLKACKDLWFLNLAGTAVTDAGLAQYKDCKALGHFQLDGTKVTDAGLAQFKDCKGLGYLAVGGTAVTDAGLAYFKDCKSLTGLNLAGTAVTDAGLAYFKDCKGLTDLDVRKTQVTAKGLEAFHAAVPECKIEHDGGIVEASDPGRRAAEYVVSLGGVVRINGLDRDLKAAAELPKERFTLAWVELHSPKVTDAGLASFEGCKGLTFINLGGGTAVTDAGLAHLMAGKGLWFLSLAGTKVTDAALAQYKDCKDLGHLQLDGTAVTDAGLAQFKDCKGLGYLSLDGTAVTDAGLAQFKDCKGLTRLLLHRTTVTDAGLAYFKGCKGLTDLGLYNTAVTDAGLAFFQDCKGLTELDVRKTQVTAKGLAAFHAAVPGCKIEYDGGAIEPKK
jgi:eukaryotic-like serine/threonine-protein kinase